MQIAHSMLDPFDRTNGNGSNSRTDDWLDESSIFDNEWGSAAATTFKPHGRDAYGRPLPRDKQEKFEDLYKLHNGKGEKSRKGDIRQSHIVNDARTFMSVLEMSAPERDRTLEILDDLDISSNNFGGRSYEKILLALFSLVSDEHLTSRRNAAVEDRLFLSDEFRELMDATAMSSSELRKTRTAIREKSDYFND